MVYIKKMVMNGFKSFGRRTEVIFDKGNNIIVGPNGSGKSNISDALCFVLGRRSAKSMRAEKAKNLIFMGTKYVKPSHEASVEMLFDNTDRGFLLDANEVQIKRVVRRDGQSIYKLNNETKTREEIVEMLAQAGITPDGFNLILQGQIQSIVRMHPEERRQIVEEVAGISVYESRKERSMHELEKTDGKLKEITTTLRERSAYLRNLESERIQALKFKEIEIMIKRLKASVLQKRIEEKQHELGKIFKSVEERNGLKDKLKEKATHLRTEVDELAERVEQINKHIQQAGGVEQETIRTLIADLKAEIEGLRVRKEGYERRKEETEKRISEMTKSIPDMRAEVDDLKKKSPMMAKKSDELKKKKDELEQIDIERKKALSTKTELNSIRERLRDKDNQIARVLVESESVLKQLEDNSRDLAYKSDEECVKAIETTKHSMTSKRGEVDALNRRELEGERILSVAESEIWRLDKIKSDVNEIDTCPLCQSKITENHKSHVFGEADEKIKEAKDKILLLKKEIDSIKDERKRVISEIRQSEENGASARMELMKHRTAKDKKMQLKKLVEDEKTLKEELVALEERRKILESRVDDLGSIEEKYNSKRAEIEEIASRTEEDLDTTIFFRERDIERVLGSIKVSKEGIGEIDMNMNDISDKHAKKSAFLKKKEEQERDLNERFNKLFEERNGLQSKIQERNLNLSDMQSEIRQIEDQIGYLNVGKAGLDASRETLMMELAEYGEVEIVKMSMNILEERLQKSEQARMEIGSINMRALEVYDEVKKGYDEVQEKVTTLENEKIEIMKIIEEIDRKKTRTFMKTFNAINELFTRNFSKLSSKGLAFLEIENKEDIFSGGVEIVVKLAKGKYFDVTSLSGGEQTLVALSLLFAIQEHKPYHFYVFDEIDAALDKRNSERLAALLNQYMKMGQYIVVTHNDAIIADSNVLYGVSMHDGISKILSLRVNEEAGIGSDASLQPQNDGADAQVSSQ